MKFKRLRASSGFKASKTALFSGPKASKRIFVAESSSSSLIWPFCNNVYIEEGRLKVRSCCGFPEVRRPRYEALFITTAVCCTKPSKFLLKLLHNEVLTSYQRTKSCKLKSSRSRKVVKIRSKFIFILIKINSCSFFY